MTSQRRLARATLLSTVLGVVATAMLLAGSAFSGSPDSATRSSQLYPEQKITLRFDHRLHVEQGAQCQLCHAEATTSEAATDDLIPDHRTCGICHQMQLPDAANSYPASGCATCHEGYSGGLPEHLGVDKMPLAGAPLPEKNSIPAARIVFSHSTHVGDGVPCLTCHQGVEKAGLATRQHLPSMATCLSCHDGGKAPSECTTCHLQGDGGRLLTDFREAGMLQPGGRFRPDDHGSSNWLYQHRSAAKVDEASCNACHEVKDCLDCHDGVKKVEGLHPADWVMTHGFEAQRRGLDCQACHDVETDCQSCHEDAGLKPGLFPGGPAATDDQGIRFHPQGWAGTVGEIPGPEHHSHTARRALDTCTSCHGGDGQDLCLECHATLVNPHPASWKEMDFRGPFGQAEGQVCSVCHRPGDPALERMNP